MGIHDRDYLRDDEPPPTLFANRPVVVQLVLINVGFFLADMLSGNHRLSDLMMVHPDTLRKPWMWWQFLTYGFAHSPESVQHILGNMFVLWMFGRFVEKIYGRKEFLAFYLTTIVIGGVLWSVRQEVMGPSASGMLGASGGVVAVFLLFVFHFPKMTVLLMLVFPVPAWVAGLLVVGSDVMLAFHAGSKVAFDVHLVGAGFAACYYYGHWRISPLLGVFQGRRPKLRVRSPDDEPEPYDSPTPRSDSRSNDQDDEDADRILEKLHREGQDSLTRKERRILEDYSRRMRQRRE
jgi:membrane associated rhomboid family serine protease